jgi:acyl-CoA thioester hydrolase
MSGGQPPFTISIEIRYADIDSLQHVNNARYFTFMEQSRAKYFAHLGLWDGRNMSGLGIILAETGCEYRRPIRYGDKVQVQARTVRLGSKSIEMRHEIVNEEGVSFATGRATLVCFDYERDQTITIPEDWRKTLKDFENLE